MMLQTSNTPPLKGAAAPVPPYVLYDVPAVALATVIGSPIAGAIVLALNYHCLGKNGKAWLTILGGIVVVAILVVLAMILPRGAAAGGAIGGVFASIAAARQLQGPDVTAHKQAGGQIGSTWTGVGIGVIGLVVALVVAGLIGLYASIPVGTRVVVGQNDEIYYRGSATEADARALAVKLTEAKYFDDSGATVELRKGGMTTITFVVKHGSWNEPGAVYNFTNLVRAAAPSVGGLPIDVRLVDDHGDIGKSWKVER